MLEQILKQISLQQIIGAFLVLFAVIDIIGSIPLIISLKQSGKKVSGAQAAI